MLNPPSNLYLDPPLHTVHNLTPALRQKRFQISRKLLARLAVGAENNILFSDEKNFTVEESHNSQNDRILTPSSKSISDEEKFVDRVQKPKYLMVWAGVSANCRTNLIFVPQGVKIDSKLYKELILESEIKHAGTKFSKTKTGSSSRILPLPTPQKLLNRGYVRKISNLFQRKSGHPQVQILTN